MAIGTDDAIWKTGTQDSLDDGSTSAVANDAFSVAADITTWTNDDDAPYGSFILQCQFSTMPTVGYIELYARPMNIDGTDDAPVPSDNYLREQIGTFAIDFGGTATNDMWLTIPIAPLPILEASQQLDFYLRNVGTAQSITAGWTLVITPLALGPAA